MRGYVANFLLISQDYPADEVLLIYDADFKYGQNFIFISSEQEKQRILNVSDVNLCINVFKYVQIITLS